MTTILDRPTSTTNIRVNFLRDEYRLLSMRIAQARRERRQSRLGWRGAVSRLVHLKRTGGGKS